jgi:hypothetical protein
LLCNVLAGCDINVEKARSMFSVWLWCDLIWFGVLGFCFFRPIHFVSCNIFPHFVPLEIDCVCKNLTWWMESIRSIEWIFHAWA